jgi:hypothetical protein
MNVAELINEVKKAGGQLNVVDGKVRVSSNTGPLPDDLMDKLRDSKAELLAALTPMGPVDQDTMAAIEAGQPVRVWSGVLGEWLWWVRAEAEREKLIAEGRTEPIYSLKELGIVKGWEPDDLKLAHAIKKDLGGTIH